MKESGFFGFFFFPTYSFQQNVHRNGLGNLAAIRAGGSICSAHYSSVRSYSINCVSEAKNTCTTPPSKDAAAAIEVHRTPYNIPGKDKAVRFSVLANSGDGF